MNVIEFDHDIYNTIRKNIKQHRKQRKMTGEQLAELVDLSYDFIRQIESEKVANTFSVDTLYRIAVVLNVSVDVLMGIQIDSPIEQQTDDNENESEK
ncbi:MAG: helix-turn-helix domain-containing protein [Oscillospiraceae bacterium]|nr:helix-turn-helix domain-containing protein [Oscillospiraceae bacterium]